MFERFVMQLRAVFVLEIAGFVVVIVYSLPQVSCNLFYFNNNYNKINFLPLKSMVVVISSSCVESGDVVFNEGNSEEAGTIDLVWKALLCEM